MRAYAAEFTDKEEALDYCQGSIYLVLEYVEHDLTGLIDRQHPYVSVCLSFLWTASVCLSIVVVWLAG